MTDARCRWLGGMLVVLLAGCGTVPPNGDIRARPASPPPTAKPPAPPASISSPSSAAQPVPPPVVEPEPPGAEMPIPPPTASIPQPPAVIALLDNASRQEKAGKLEAAAATLERAVRVDPRNPLVWHRLARVRLAQGQWQAAANVAAKSNSLAAGDTELQRRNWRVIAEARQRMGDNAGARAARAHAEK